MDGESTVAKSSPQAPRRPSSQLPFVIALAMVFWCAPVVALYVGLAMAGDCDPQAWTSCSAAQEFGVGFAGLIFPFLLFVSLPLTVLFAIVWSFRVLVRYIRRCIRAGGAPPASAESKDAVTRGSGVRRLVAISCAAIFLGSACVSSVVLWDEHESLTRSEFKARLPTSGSESEFTSALQRLVSDSPSRTKVHVYAHDSPPWDNSDFPLARRYISVSVVSGSWVREALDPFCNDGFGASIYFDGTGNYLGTKFYDSKECL